MLALHLPTLALALVACFGLLVVLYTVSGQRWLPPGELRRWALLCLLLLAGTALMALAPQVPQGWVAGGANLALGSGLLALVLALLRFLRQPLRRRTLTLAFGGYCLLVLLASVLADAATRVAISSLAAAAFLLPLAVTLQRHGWHAERSLRGVAVALWVLDAMLLLRGLHALLDPGAHQQVDAAGWAPPAVALPYTIGLLALLALAFGYLLAAQERAHHRLRRLATRDALTGLSNRRQFENRLNRALAHLPRSKDALTLALMDIDHFKRINDQHGHAVGDLALCHLAQLLRPRLRRADTLARWGGEEFMLLLPGTDLAGAAHLMGALRDCLKERPLRLQGGEELALTVSIGWAWLPAGSAPPAVAQLMHELDLAMYAVKQNGRDGAQRALLDGQRPAVPTRAPLPPQD